MRLDYRGLPLCEQRKIIRAMELAFRVMPPCALARWDQEWQAVYSTSQWISPLEREVSQQLQSERAALLQSAEGPLE
jgi:hypothetical protein